MEMIKNLPCRIENVISEVKGKIYMDYLLEWSNRISSVFRDFKYSKSPLPNFSKEQ
jgi:hypothetical protein